jgi:hypothetical protein
MSHPDYILTCLWQLNAGYGYFHLYQIVKIHQMIQDVRPACSCNPADKNVPKKSIKHCHQYWLPVFMTHLNHGYTLTICAFCLGHYYGFKSTRYRKKQYPPW